MTVVKRTENEYVVDGRTVVSVFASGLGYSMTADAKSDAEAIAAIDAVTQFMWERQ